MRHILAILLLTCLAGASTTTLTGKIADSQGTGLNGQLIMTLPVPARDVATSTAVAPGPTFFRLVNGNITGGAPLYDVANLQPQGLYYQARAYDTAGNLQFYGNYIVTGATFNLGSATPTTVTTSNISYSGVGFTGLNNVWTGQNTFQGISTFSNIDGIQFASQQTGADASCKIQNAIGALPASGGTVFGYDLTDVGGLGACTVDPGTKSVTLMLGPFTYHFTQLVLRTNFHIVGQGAGTGSGGSPPPTVMVSTGSNATPLFVLPSVGAQIDVIIRGVNIQGLAGNTSQTAFSLIAPSAGGLWYSEFDDVVVSGFKGMGLDLEAPVTAAPNGINQFNTFKRVVIFRVSGGSYALQIKGFNNSLKFENCQFDGNPAVAGGDGLTNINIQDVNAITFPPYDIKFDLLTSQWAGIAMQFNGADSVSVDQGHFEGDFNAITTGTGSSFGSQGITVHDSFFGNGTGVNGGNGSIINQLAAAGNVDIKFIDNHIYNAPDAIFKTNVLAIYQCGNTLGPEGSYTWIPCSNRSTGVIALATGSIGAHACTAAQTASVSNVATTSALAWNFTTTPVGVTGYGDGTTPFLVVTVFPTANTVNAVVCNTSAGAITPGAISIRVSAQNTNP